MQNQKWWIEWKYHWAQHKLCSWSQEQQEWQQHSQINMMGWSFYYGGNGHLELYQKSREAISDNIQVEYLEGNTVAEWNFVEMLEYQTKLSGLPTKVSWTDKEIWTREVTKFMTAKKDIPKELNQAYTLMQREYTD